MTTEAEAALRGRCSRVRIARPAAATGRGRAALSQLLLLEIRARHRPDRSAGARAASSDGAATWALRAEAIAVECAGDQASDRGFDAIGRSSSPSSGLSRRCRLVAMVTKRQLDVARDRFGDASRRLAHVAVAEDERLEIACSHSGDASRGPCRLAAPGHGAPSDGPRCARDSPSCTTGSRRSAVSTCRAHWSGTDEGWPCRDSASPSTTAVRRSCSSGPSGRGLWRAG